MPITYYFMFMTSGIVDMYGGKLIKLAYVVFKVSNLAKYRTN